MERQKPRKEREADAKAADEAEAARKAEAERESAASGADFVEGATPGASRRALREQGPAVAAADTDAGATTGASGSHDDEIVEDTIIPEVVSDDEPVDDTEPAGSHPIIDVVPVSLPASSEPAEAADDDTLDHAEILAPTDDTSSTVVEEMVIDLPADAVDPTHEAAAHAEAEERKEATPPLAPLFQSPSERTTVTSENLPSSFDDLISVRNAAAANSISTTSALVLPTVPGSNDVGTALDETGEVIITGSIDLPASFGSLGAPASGLESGDLDTLLERSEVEQTGSDVAPVSASRAISTNTSSTSLITPPKRARANAPVVLAVTAAVLAVGVVGLLLAVFVFRVF
ncbi:hypothetical protein [Herbiconiux sp. YIM B11900]|uniref:hypothetical protein n=1 Tax=Herbiconiux sp. YIM B11900 TaxID=3404131 RepID=UPI003F835141